MQAIIALILANLPTIIQAGKAGYDFVSTVRSAAKQTGEWTDADESAFQSKLAAEAIDPAWLPDAALETAAAVTKAPAPLVASVDLPKCPVCGKDCPANHPDNCACVAA